MKRPIDYLIPLLLLLLHGFGLNGQTIFTSQPLASPHATVSQTIGITEVSIDYHRPAVKDREVWDKVVPAKAVWRAGANDNTVFTVTDDVMINGNPLPAGSYGLHLIPDENKATLIFSNNATSWGSYSYNPKEDALRVEIEPIMKDYSTEWLTYAFQPVSNDEAKCYLKWEKMAYPFTISVDLEETAFARIQDELRHKAGWTWIGWNEAANFCLNNGIHLKQGMAWAGRSVFMNPNANNIMTKANIAGALEGYEDKKEAAMLASIQKDIDANHLTWKDYFNLYNTSTKKGLFTEVASTWLDKSISMDANMTNMIAKSKMLEASGDSKGAAKYKEKALASGTNAEMNNYGYQLLFAGSTEDAIEVFKMNAEKHPEDPNTWDSLGEGYFTAGNHEKATKCFKKSLSLNPPANVKANSTKYLIQMGVEEEETHP